MKIDQVQRFQDTTAAFLEAAQLVSYVVGAQYPYANDSAVCFYSSFDVSILCVWSENGTASLCLKCANQHGPVLTDDVFGTFKFSPDGRWVQSFSI